MSARGLGSAAAMVAVPTVPASPGVPLDGRYRLDAPIAAGGMGEVWRATDLVLDRPVAVKMLRPGYAAREEDLARFRAEARHAGLLSHPGIAKVYDYRDGDPPYLVMELVDGPSLARLLDNGPVAAALTMSLIAQAARALQAAHAAGLVHRDINRQGIRSPGSPPRFGTPVPIAAIRATASLPPTAPAAPAPLRRPAGATGPGPDASHPGRAPSRHQTRSPH